MIGIHIRTSGITIQHAYSAQRHTIFIKILISAVASIQYCTFPFYLFLNIDLYPLKSLILWGLPTYSWKNNFFMCGVYKFFLIVHVHWHGEILTVQWQIKSLPQNRMRNIIPSGLCISVISANQKTAGNNIQHNNSLQKSKSVHLWRI